MICVDEENHIIDPEGVDPETGYWLAGDLIDPAAAPIDNVTKFAWEAEDYIPVRRFVRWSEEERIRRERDALLAKLGATDYAVLKIAEGAADREDYAAVLQARQGWRLRLRELEEG